MNGYDLDGRSWITWLVSQAVGQLGGMIANLFCDTLGPWMPLCQIGVQALVAGATYFVLTKIMHHGTFSWGGLGVAVLSGAVAGLLNSFGWPAARGVLKKLFGKVGDFLKPRLRRLGWAAVMTAYAFIESKIIGKVTGPRRSSPSEPPCRYIHGPC